MAGKSGGESESGLEVVPGFAAEIDEGYSLLVEI